MEVVRTGLTREVDGIEVVRTGLAREVDGIEVVRTGLAREVERTTCKTPPLLAVEVVRTGEACPFTNEKVGFELRQGEVVWLRGASGAGKSFTCLHLAGLAELPGARVHAQWNSSVPAAERVGFLFQKGVLIDSLNLAENVALALRASGRPHPPA